MSEPPVPPPSGSAHDIEILHANQRVSNNGADQTVRMGRLICNFAGRMQQARFSLADRAIM